MDPNQTNETGQQTPAQGGVPEAAPTPTPDAGTNPQPPSSSENPTPADTSSPYSALPTDTTTGTAGEGTVALTTQAPSFLGIPVDVLLVGGPIFMIGILVCAWLTGRKDHTEQLSRLDRQRKRSAQRDSEKPETIDIFAQQRVNFLGKILAEAGLEAQYAKMKTTWIMCIVGVTGGTAVLCAMQAPPLAPLSIIFGPGIGSFAFIQYVKWQGNQRQKKLTAQLPQVLESMVSTLKAGSPIIECMKLLSETAPEPIRAEFRRALVSMQLGKPFRDVIGEMGTRIRTQDFKLLSTAIFISQDVGANLADVVATIAEAIRERFRLRDFLGSLTAQGKMTALFIGALPYFITGMTYVITPNYIIPFLNHPIARIVFIAMMIWEAIGAYILVKMTTFEV